MKRTIIIIVTVVICLLLLFTVAEKKIDARLKNLQYSEGTLNNIMESRINASLLIVGTSRAKYQITPFSFYKRLNLNSYNIGQPGAKFELQKEILELYLKHNVKPKYIIWHIEPQMLSQQEIIFRDEDYIPYLNEPEIRRLFNKYKSNISFLELNIPMFKYNAYFELLKMVFSPSKKVYKTYDTLLGFIGNDNITNKGFMPNRITQPFGLYAYTNKTTIDSFKKYLLDLEQKGITIILTTSPLYYKERKYYKNNLETDILLEDIALTTHIPLLNFTDDTMSNNISYYYDSEHMNTKGAYHYTQLLINSIMQYSLITISK